MRQYHFYKDEQIVCKLKIFNTISIILLLIVTIVMTEYYKDCLEYFLVFLCGSLAIIAFSFIVYIFKKKGLE